MSDKIYTMSKMNFKGFTLAEVLVTLAVIGIVAALTIPSLLKNSFNSEAASKVKKYSSILNQNIMMYAANNGCTGNLANCGAFSGDWNESGHQQVWQALKSYFKLARDCGTSISSSSGCFPSGITYKFLNGNDDNVWNDPILAKSVLLDGASMRIRDRNGNCNESVSRAGQNPLNEICGEIGIDINGPKSPNQVGRDYFVWWITRSGAVYPAGLQDDLLYATPDGTADCNPDDSGGGWMDPGGGYGCAAKIIRDGKINY